MNNIIKKLGIAALCLATGLGGFGIGKATSFVDKVTFQGEYRGGISGFKAVKINRPYGDDEIFIRQNGCFHPHPESYSGMYLPMEKYLVNSYGPIDEEGRTITKRKLEEIKELFSLQESD